MWPGFDSGLDIKFNSALRIFFSFRLLLKSNISLDSMRYLTNWRQVLSLCLLLEGKNKPNSEHAIFDKNWFFVSGDFWEKAVPPECKFTCEWCFSLAQQQNSRLLFLTLIIKNCYRFLKLKDIVACLKILQRMCLQGWRWLSWSSWHFHPDCLLVTYHKTNTFIWKVRVQFERG